ncbi:flagellar filament capping protein FliD [Geothrix sp.]|jgi:flagellar hook-associated protein 2|uniref:flagellar filament capping protein FliD n=1 Tax=Geothrix sp. TaxID=1962974 RepID=UPI0025C30DEB|nr:flagellar filament capping protein FliD [Geothrix sp.]
MASSSVSFSGIFSGVQTDQLVTAILQQESLPLQRLQARQAANTKRTTALTTMSSNLAALGSSLAALSATSFDARSVASSDPNGTYVSATASGAAVGSYDLRVTQVATRARISPAQGPDLGGPTNTMAVANPQTTAIFAPGSTESFGIRGTDGVVHTFSLTDPAQNNLNALRDAINASGAGVTASVVNTGSGSTPYQLVLTAQDTGTGSTQGVITLADLTAGGSTNTIGITASADPVTLAGGLQSPAAVDALFTLNGVSLTRKSNVVTDAVDGMTFTLKQGGQTGSTTLTVSQDKSAITTAMQDVVSKYNTLLQAYKAATAVTKDSSGNKTAGVLTGDGQTRAIMQQVRAALTGVATGLPGGATLTAPSAVGLKTGADGTLSLDVTAFQKALDTDPAAVKQIFTNAAGGGVAQVTGKTITDITAAVTGSLAQDMQQITLQNQSLTSQISTWQSRMDRRKAVLTAQFARMESAVSQLQGSATALSKLS